MARHKTKNRLRIISISCTPSNQISLILFIKICRIQILYGIKIKIFYAKKKQKTVQNKLSVLVRKLKRKLNKNKYSASNVICIKIM